HKVLTPEEGDGILVAYSYSPEIVSPANEAFLKAWSAKYGNTDQIHEIAVSHYQGIHVWAEAVRKADDVGKDALTAAIEGGLSIDGPGGKVTIDPKTHHAVLDVHLMEMSGQKLKVIESFPQRQPADTQG
ncbi:ABC transporter substrate-binding protein, partial [Rhizobiaceae sp. 2RAB30]